MDRPTLRGVAATGSVALAMLLALTAAGDAQTWQWMYVTHSANTPPLAAQSTVAVAAGRLQMTYTVPIGHRQVVIESCRAALDDVASATTVRSQGRVYLLVQLKPAHAAACASGQRPAVALPTNDERYIRGVAVAINRSCCSTIARANAVRSNVTPEPRRPSARSTLLAVHASPAPSPSPITRASPAPAITDWVESQGLFSFVRVRNANATPLHIRDVEVFSCRDVGLGCGRSPREFNASAKSIVTIATIASSNQHNLPAFNYRYFAAHGDASVARNGSSGTTAPRRGARMSAQEIRTAEADALETIRSKPPDVAVTIVPARLVRRGSSRLAIGETGTALVRLVIAANGTPQEATIVTISNRRLAAAAIETAVSSTYAPATQNGKPLAAKYVATFSFDGTDPATASIPVWKRSPLPSANGSPLPTNQPSAAAEPAVSAAPEPSAAPSASPQP